MCMLKHNDDENDDDHDGVDDEDDEAKSKKIFEKNRTLAIVIANIRRINTSNIHQSALKLVLTLLLLLWLCTGRNQARVCNSCE